MNAERAQCVIWTTESSGATVVQRLFRDECVIMHPARSKIRLWRANYQHRRIIRIEKETDTNE